MKQALKEKWIAALRSGEYNQGRRHLYAFNNSYCCLGVLCKVMGFDENDFASSGYIADYLHYNRKDGTQAPIPFDVEQELANMNDNGSDFNTIADYIEKNL